MSYVKDGLFVGFTKLRVETAASECQAWLLLVLPSR